MREIRLFDSYFNCEIMPGRVNSCISDKIVSKHARISGEVYKSGSVWVYKYDDLSMIFDKKPVFEVGDLIEVIGRYEKRLINDKNVQKRLIVGNYS